MNIEVKQEVMEEGINLLIANAFSSMQDNDSWSNNNPLHKFLKDVMKDNEDKIKNILSEYLMNVIESEDFRLSVKSEYTKMLAKAMLQQVRE